MKKNNIDYKAIIEFLKTPKGKAVMFFGFYFIFFLILSAMFRSGAVNDDSLEKSKNKNNFPFSLGKIESNNYHFKYSIDMDSKIITYEGDKYNKKELFKFNNLSYYRNDSVFLTNNSNIWVKCDNPYIMYEFIDIDSIKKILSKATYISKTDYESGMKVYNYQISTSTLIKVISNIDVDLDDKPNEIILKTDDRNNVNVIKYDLTSYSKYNKLANNKGEIELNYTKFGEIKKITDPE